MTALRLGSATTTITPGPEAELLGYDFRQAELRPGNSGVHDPLLVRAWVFDDGEALAAWISLDVCILSVAAARQLRSAVAEALGIGRERVILACSHTHSGPMVADEDLAVTRVLPHTKPGSAPDRHLPLAQLADQVLEAVRLAAGLTRPVVQRVHQAPVGLGYTRRVLTEDGVELCWNPREQTHLRPQAAGDPAMVVAEWREQCGDRRWALVNHGAHPVVLGKTSTVVSADWPGAMRADLEAAEPGLEMSFALGACGDVHPWIATQDSASGVAIVGAAAAAQARLLLHAGGEPESPARLVAREQTLTIAGTDMDLVAWRCGSLTWMAVPVEWFAGLGAALRSAHEGAVLLATNANGWTGYWPDKAAFAVGRYEVDAARAHGREAGCGEALLEAAQTLLEEVS